MFVCLFFFDRLAFVYIIFTFGLLHGKHITHDFETKTRRKCSSAYLLLRCILTNSEGISEDNTMHTMCRKSKFIEKKLP